MMPAPPGSSSTNPHGLRPGRGGSSYSRPTRRPMPYIQVMRHRGATLALLTVLSGCFTGPRPSYTTEPFPRGSSSGDAAIDNVLAQLDADNDGPYTANYTVLTKFGNITRPASVSVAAGRRSVTVGDVRFITTDGASQTCILDKTDPCSSSIDPARISDTQITPDFYAADAAKRLRRSAVARIGQPIPHTEQIGRPIGDVRRRAGERRSVYVLCVDERSAGAPRRRRRDNRAHAVHTGSRRVAVRDDRLVTPLRRRR